MVKNAADAQKVVLLPGDGVGPEVTAEAKKILERVSDLRSAVHGDNLNLVFQEELLGGAAIDATGALICLSRWLHLSRCFSNEYTQL